MWANLLKLLFRGKLYFAFFPSYLSTMCLISFLQCLPFLFFQCHATIHPQSACCAQQITIPLFLSLWPQTVCFLFRLWSPSPHCPLSAILSPPSAPCYLWNAKLQRQGEWTWCYARSQTTQAGTAKGRLCTAHVTNRSLLPPFTTPTNLPLTLQHY
jgi:hypothetical protein